jgi:hypothetical protein
VSPSETSAIRPGLASAGTGGGAWTEPPGARGRVARLRASSRADAMPATWRRLAKTPSTCSRAPRRGQVTLQSNTELEGLPACEPVLVCLILSLEHKERQRHDSARGQRRTERDLRGGVLVSMRPGHQR